MAALIDGTGVVYDAFTLDRWSDPDRTNFMEQQSASQAGKPWVKLDDMGSNVRQMTQGPDGNKQAAFNGRSGVRVTIQGAGEPELTGYGELYANFIYRSGGGSMEVPLVRGSALLSHVLKNANPVITPYCLAAINRHQVNFNCPQEPNVGDGGVGFLEGECHGGTLTITLHSTQVIKDLGQVQWAAEKSANWPNRNMRTCDSAHCSTPDGGKTVKMTIPNASGVMNYAVNYIGHYVTPWDWGNKPMVATCTGKREVSERAISDITVSATCSASLDLQITVDMSPTESFPGIDHFQYAVEPASTWVQNYTPGMHTCTSASCRQTGNKVVISTKAPANEFKLALNIIGETTLPKQNWLDRPYQGKCDGSVLRDGDTSTNPVTSKPGGNNNNQPFNPTYSTSDIAAASKKFVMELNEPGTDLPGQTRKFIVYFSSPVVARIDEAGSKITFEPQGGGAYTGLAQIVYAGSSPRGDGSKVNFFDKYAGFYAYSPTLKYCASQSTNKAYVSYDWNTKDANGNAPGGHLLMVTMPHHAVLIQKTHPEKLIDTPFVYKGYEGNDWLMEYDILHTEIDPDPQGVAKVKANPSQLKDILAAIDRDAQKQNLDGNCAHTDSYNGGKDIGMVSRLASLSRAFGTNHYQKLDESIKNCLEKWLRITDTLDNLWKFHYDTVWGGLFLRATTDAQVDWGTDYGFPYYNDHHFHLGYYIYAMAYYVKHNQAWGNAHKDRIYALVRDVGNPSSKDAYFPVARQKDHFTGFSIASGLVPGIRQEESSSEGINCYHGIAGLGDAFNDQNLKQTGQVLLAMEIQSVREYWQVRNHNRAHFPPVIQNYGVVGMITESDFYAYTLDWPCWPNIFPQRHACLVGIQVIPITAVSKYWVDQEWAASIRQSCEWANNPSSHPSYHLAEMTDELKTPLGIGWQAFCHAAMAPLDAAHATAAANFVRNLGPQDLVGGTGSASTLLFIYAST
ncbi:hypothetical protein BsWGS_09798 [Bradybaena similaris]